MSDSEQTLRPQIAGAILRHDFTAARDLIGEWMEVEPAAATDAYRLFMALRRQGAPVVELAAAFEVDPR